MDKKPVVSGVVGLLCRQCGRVVGVVNASSHRYTTICKACRGHEVSSGTRFGLTEKGAAALGE